MPKIILTTNMKGGVGKSTLTFNLAKSFGNSFRKNKKYKIAIVDIDYQGSLQKVSNYLDGIEVFSFKGKVAELKELEYDFIFVDTPPYYTPILDDLCNTADVILVPTKPSILDILELQTLINVINKVGAIDKTLVVLNMVKHNVNLDSIYSEIKKMNVNISNVEISNLVAYERSIFYGLEGENKAYQQITELAKEVLMLM